MPGNTGFSPRIERFPDPQALAEAVANIVTAAVSEGVRHHGRAYLILSGGGTPAIYLPRIARLDLPWNMVNILLADERWVDEDSLHSNTAMLRRTLFSQTGPTRVNFIPLKNTAASASAGLAIARAGLPPLDQGYDLALLGMGNDGHFASLFPGTPRLTELLSPENTERVVAVPPPTNALPKVERISLTLAEIRRSERVVLVLQGAAKLEVLNHVSEIADANQTPVFALGNIEVLWCP